MFPTNFAAAVRAAFSYLSDYNFVEVSADPHHVIFTRGGWSIDIFFVPFEYEVSLSIAHLDKRFEIHSFIAAIDPDEFSRTMVLTGSNDLALRTSLAALASRLQMYGARALSGDPAVMELVASDVAAYDQRRGQGLIS